MIADNWVSTPVTTLVVQIEPGPIPTFIASTPALINHMPFLLQVSLRVFFNNFILSINFKVVIVVHETTSMTTTSSNFQYSTSLIMHYSQHLLKPQQQFDCWS